MKREGLGLIGENKKVLSLNMLSPELLASYPNLANDGGDEKSKKNPQYNCIAWAAEWDDQRWWQPEPFEPGMYWPKGVNDDGSFKCFVDLFENLKYRKADSADLELFYEKVAIYKNILGRFTHVARQKHSGIWWSKLGEDQDVYHNSPEGLESQKYGKPSVIMKRPCGLIGILARAFFKVKSSFGF